MTSACENLRISDLGADRGSPKLFEAAAPKIRGRIRTYFAKTAAEIQSTGSSNWATQITGTPWFASVNNSELKRAQMINDLMRAMDFSYNYRQLISELCLNRQATLPAAYTNALAKLSSPLMQTSRWQAHTTAVSPRTHRAFETSNTVRVKSSLSRGAGAIPCHFH